MSVNLSALKKSIYCQKLTHPTMQGHSIVPIHFMYMDMFSSVGASCARDLAKKR